MAGRWGRKCGSLCAALLAAVPQFRVDPGYLGRRVCRALPGDILVGHSAGLLWGLRRRQDWAGVVAINSFDRFTTDGTGRGCVKSAALRAMQKALVRDAQNCVENFRASHRRSAAGGRRKPKRWRQAWNCCAILTPRLFWRKNPGSSSPLKTTRWRRRRRRGVWRRRRAQSWPFAPRAATDCPGPRRISARKKLRDFCALMNSDENAVIRAFDAAAGTYDSASQVQREIARELVFRAAAGAERRRAKFSISAAAPAMSPRRR